jgi:hypothetical protein
MATILEPALQTDHQNRDQLGWQERPHSRLDNAELPFVFQNQYELCDEPCHATTQMHWTIKTMNGACTISNQKTKLAL